MRLTFFQKLKRFFSRLFREFQRQPKRVKRNVFIVLAGILVLIILWIIIATSCSAAARRREAQEAEQAQQASIAAYEQQMATTVSDSHMIQGVPVIKQNELSAGCETYACTMLLQSLGFDTDEFDFSDNYLICRDIYYDENGTRYGPDMYSAFAGTVYNGYGIYAPAMAKSMDSFFEAKGSPLRAKPLKGVTLQQLCDEYIDKDTPVMVWATCDMQEPYEKASWVVYYTDENAVTKEGDTFTWLQNEHCLVLIGYDGSKYYFSDSVAGGVSSWDKALCEERFKQLGSQAIVAQ